jgi:hypothetical protein
VVFWTEGRGIIHRRLGAIDTMLWHLLQASDFERTKKMSTTILLGVAFAVFTLMMTGLVLTMREFQQMEDPQSRKGPDIN